MDGRGKVTNCLVVLSHPCKRAAALNICARDIGRNWPGTTNIDLANFNYVVAIRDGMVMLVLVRDSQ